MASIAECMVCIEVVTCIEPGLVILPSRVTLAKPKLVASWPAIASVLTMTDPPKALSIALWCAGW